MTAEREKEFHEQLVRHKLIVPSDVQGVFGRGAVFEDVLQRFNDAVTRAAAKDGADVYHFPPVVSRHVVQKSEFLDSFPQLCGTVFSFSGTDKQHKELIEKLHGHEEWQDSQSMTQVCLTPAACYPIYPTFTGTLPANGRLVDMTSYCFRHEPSPDPARMQAFRVREFVRCGDAEMVTEWRDMWLQRGLKLLLDCGLPAKSDVASDPFFGRGGRLLAVNQKEQKLKFEVLIPITDDEKTTACCSFNYHQEHFGQLFDIQTAKGETAQTACLGFGMERVTMALFHTHGFEPQKWPASVRKQLWP